LPTPRIQRPLSRRRSNASGQATEDRLPQHTDKSVTAIIAGARVSEPLARHRGKAKCVVKFAIGKQPRSRDRTAKLERQSPVEIEPENAIARFTRRVRHGRLDQ
jgi:hypothetical protein